MALSTKWTLAQLKACVRRELLDSTAKWWTDEELDTYINAWQDRLQDDLELVWGTATVTTSTSTLTLTAVATDILRLEAIYWDGTRLVGRSPEDLDLLDRDWRDATPATPVAAYQLDDLTVSFYPAPSALGTVVFEYPKDLVLATDTSTMQVPAWTRYSCVNYCAWRAYARFGPNQDIDKALRRKAKFERQLRRYRTIMANYFPNKAPTLRLGGVYEGDILYPTTHNI